MLQKHTADVLNKVFVREFYRMNSGFFLLTATLAFGFMSQAEHVALAQFFVSSPAALLIPVCIWIAYALKILAFNIRQLRSDEMRFLFNIQFLPFTQQLILSALVISLQFLPALCYGMFLILIGWKIKAFQSAIIIPLGLAVIWSACSLWMTRTLRSPFNDHNVSLIKRLFDARFTRNVVQFYSEGILRRDPLMIAGTKILTMSLVFGVSVLYRHEHYDGRLLAMALTVCGVANALVIFRVVTFEHSHMTWMKNMPIPYWKRFARLVIVVCILVLPEAVILVRNYPVHMQTFAWSLDVLYLISLGVFFLGYFHLRATTLEYYTRKVFWIFIAVIVLILFKTPLILFIILNVLSGYQLFRRGYYILEMSE